MIALRLPDPLTERRFEQLCQINPELRLESDTTEELIVMSPTGSETGLRNCHLLGQLWWWNEQTGLGKVFDSSTGFRLPNGAHRSPDAAWVTLARWSGLSSQQRRHFAPLCPDFVAELRSPSDSVMRLRDKMLEYTANGARLGWLIDIEQAQVEIYRPGRALKTLDSPASVGGEDVLPGFTLQLTRIWSGE